MDNVHDIKERLDRRLQGSGDPPDNREIEARLAKLEAVIPTLATKVDLLSELGRLEREIVRVEHSIRADMHREFTAQTWRIIGAMITFGGLLATVMFFILKNTGP